MASDIYAPLSNNPASIRIVRLAPSRSFGQISVAAQLIEASWDQYSYEALSYCWGKRHKTKTILLNGEQVQVTADLHDALQQFSLEDGIRSLWVSFYGGKLNSWLMFGD